jgi:hypothetical protein
MILKELGEVFDDVMYIYIFDKLVDKKCGKNIDHSKYANNKVRTIKLIDLGLKVQIEE